ncbi:CBS domain-containing protein [Stratiformator vulcanicus]|uniref:Inosine-5'-monophosphate dehydrogenase n=1 Tax=Stratiformator vulcanicus TaxID=2527980 RepID=A0A517QW04_9PLAN|nr:CBS domain-containing protein [Stratiformator vulcanicus]QDT35845.1 Inosine-5'-monophosphate dehydrogenase [Stratiformator vulcanicus]
MMHSLTARNIMVTRLVTLKAGMDVYAAIATLLKHRISGAPVLDENGDYIGVFSEKCSMRVILDAACESLPQAIIDPFIDRHAKTVDPDTDILSIAQMFEEMPCRRLPVLEDGKVVGQVSRRDLLRSVHDMLLVAPAGRDSDLLYLSSLMDRNDSPIS